MSECALDHLPLARQIVHDKEDDDGYEGCQRPKRQGLPPIVVTKVHTSSPTFVKEHIIMYDKNCLSNFCTNEKRAGTKGADPFCLPPSYPPSD